MIETTKVTEITKVTASWQNLFQKKIFQQKSSRY